MGYRGFFFTDLPKIYETDGPLYMASNQIEILFAKTINQLIHQIDVLLGMEDDI